MWDIALGLGLLLLVGVLVTLGFSEPFRAQVVSLEPSVSMTRLPNIPFVLLPPSPPFPPPSSAPVASQSTYPLHTDITATVFWVGETASAENGWIANDQSFWDVSWREHFGGVDDPDNRNSYAPADFIPKENPFYIALPYGDYDGHQPKANADRIHWYQTFPTGTSLLKNRWVKITAKGKTAYGQWEDVGPFETDDIEYVFGAAQPKASVGIDLSPAIRDYLGFGGKTIASWQFVDEKDVPPGPWKEIVTTSGVSW